MIVRPQRDEDFEAARHIYTEAFRRPGDPGSVPLEVPLFEALWEAGDVIAELSFTAETEGGAVGHVTASKATVAAEPVVAVGPIGVLPEHQGMGIGSGLMQSVPGRCRRRARAARRAARLAAVLPPLRIRPCGAAGRDITRSGMGRRIPGSTADGVHAARRRTVPVRAGLLDLGGQYDPRVQEVATGVWHWQAPHPEWDDSVWPQLVSSYAIDDGERLLLFDPIAPPPEILAASERRKLVVVLTSPWHERDTRALVETHDPPVFFTDPGEGSPDVAWLVSGEVGEPHLYSAGGDLPPGVDAAFRGREPNDVVLWVASRRAIVAGDTLVDFGDGDGLKMHEPWISTSRMEVVEQLRPLLELPVEHVLAMHGGPHDRAALHRALA